ncbi:unnamed protein product [Effrenium voratum]|nr:unnamed protein product [Effrenium voratum]
MPGETRATFFWGGVYASGIIVALWVYGLLQERIMSQPYDGVMFGDSVFLVFCNRFVAIWFGLGMATAQGEEVGLKAPVWRYMIVSLSNVFATTCQYEALKYVSFPVQMLGKSFKMMPVMLWGIVISSKRYALKDRIRVADCNALFAKSAPEVGESCNVACMLPISRVRSGVSLIIASLWLIGNYSQSRSSRL